MAWDGLRRACQETNERVDEFYADIIRRHILAFQRIFKVLFNWLEKVK